jgi:hypothetical protein
MAKDTDNVLFRLSPDTASILEKMAAGKGFSEAMILEQLVRRVARETAVIDADHPEAAFESLLTAIEDMAVHAHPDFTFEVFKRIEAASDIKTRYDQAIVPLPGQSADRRKWHVNQTIGRFCKRICGWESGEQIQVPKGECSLIKTYTRLKPPSTPPTAEGKLSQTAEKLEAAKQALEKLDLVISEVTLVRSGV